MDIAQKNQIIQKAKEYIVSQGISQNRLAEVSGVKPSHLSHILQGKSVIQVGKKSVEINDKYYSDLAAAIGFQCKRAYWQHFDTANYQAVWLACDEAKRLKERRAIDGLSGLGKSYAVGMYAKDKPAETYLIACKDDYSPKEFMIALSELLGIKLDGRKATRAYIRKEITAKLLKMKTPLLIIDEAENLKDAAWSAVKDIADDLEGKCGIVIVGANDFKGQIRRKARVGKRAYPQIESRFTEHSEWILLSTLNATDIKEVCYQSGIKDKLVISWVVKQTEGQDFRDLKRCVSKLLRESVESGYEITMELVNQIF